jgi:hypothetical protein
VLDVEHGRLRINPFELLLLLAEIQITKEAACWVRLLLPLHSINLFWEGTAVLISAALFLLARVHFLVEEGRGSCSGLRWILARESVNRVLGI